MTPTLLGLPWWAWIPIACAAGLLHMVVTAFGQLARRRHRLTCRVYWQLRAIAHPWSFVASNLALWAMWSPSPIRYFLAWDVLMELRWCWRAFVRKQTLTGEPFPMVDFETGEEFPCERMFVLAGTWQQAWRHREHDDDCEFGPTKQWGGATARLRGWVKVALNPVFAPS